MHILDQNSDKSLINITLYLTHSEAIELRDSLNDLLENPLNNHAHISNESYQKEITVCIYDKNNLEGFNKRSLRLIMEDQ